MGYESHLQRLVQGRSCDQPPAWSTWPLRDRFRLVSEKPTIYECVDRSSPLFGSQYNEKGRPFREDAREFENDLAEAQDVVTSVSLKQDLSAGSAPGTEPQEGLEALSVERSSSRRLIKKSAGFVEVALHYYLWDSALARVLLFPPYQHLHLTQFLAVDFKQSYFVLRLLFTGTICFLNRLTYAYAERLGAKWIISDIYLFSLISSPWLDKFPLLFSRRRLQAWLNFSIAIVPFTFLSFLQFVQTALPLSYPQDLFSDPLTFYQSFSLTSQQFYQSATLTAFYTATTGYLISILRPSVAGVLHYLLHLRASRRLRQNHQFKHYVLGYYEQNTTPNEIGFKSFNTMRRVHTRLYALLPRLIPLPLNTFPILEEDDCKHRVNDALLFNCLSNADMRRRLVDGISFGMAKVILVPLQAFVLHRVASMIVNGPSAGRMSWSGMIAKVGLCLGVSLGADLGRFVVVARLRKIPF